MIVDVVFSFAKVYDVNRIDVVKGQSFELLTDHEGESKWFSDNDEVLDLKVKNNNAIVKAESVGTSTIMILDGSKRPIKELTISILDAIEPLATQLNLTADEPIEK